MPILPEILHPYISTSSLQGSDAPRFFTTHPFFSSEIHSQSTVEPLLKCMCYTVFPTRTQIFSFISMQYTRISLGFEF